MFPRKKSIVTVNGFPKSYVDINEAILKIQTATSDSDLGNYIDNRIEERIRQGGMPYKTSAPMTTSIKNTPVLNSYVLEPDTYYNISDPVPKYLPNENAEKRGVSDAWEGDVENLDELIAELEDDTVHLILSVPYINTNPSTAHEYFFQFTANASVGAIRVSPTLQDSPFGLPIWTYDLNVIDAPDSFKLGGKYLIHIIGDNMFFHTLYEPRNEHQPGER